MKKIYVLIFLTSVIYATGFAQTKSKNRVVGVLNHTFSVFDKNVISVPAYGLDYEHWLNEKFGLGIFTDLEIYTHKYYSNNKIDIETEFPFLISVDGIYQPIEHWEIVVGAGYEFSKDVHNKVIRFGLEHDIYLDKKWDVSPSIFYNLKSHTEPTITIGIGIGKSF